MGIAMVEGTIRNPLKAGPWVWYHDNSEKSSEGSYRRNVPVGPWVYYDANGRVTDVKNFINGKSKAISTAELENGKKGNTHQQPGWIK